MKKILVVVNDKKFLERIMTISCQIAKFTNAILYVVYVYEVPRSLALNSEIPEEIAKADEILDRASEISDQYNIDIETDIVQARFAGQGIVDEAIDLQAELIVMGISEEPLIEDIYFDSSINYVLKNSNCEVLIYKGVTK